MNNVALVGRLTADVELRTTAGCKTFAMFTVAVNRPFKNKETNEYDADFIRCKAFGVIAEFVTKYFGKGKPIGIAGWIQTGKYTDKNGNQVFSTDVMVEKAEFVGNKDDGGNNERSGNAAKPTKNTSNHKPELEYEDALDTDDDYPF